MGDDNTNTKKRNMKWMTSYSNMSYLDAEKRLGLTLEEFAETAVPANKILATIQRECEMPGADAISDIKKVGV